MENIEIELGCHAITVNIGFFSAIAIPSLQRKLNRFKITVINIPIAIHIVKVKGTGLRFIVGRNIFARIKAIIRSDKRRLVSKKSDEKNKKRAES